MSKRVWLSVRKRGLVVASAMGLASITVGTGLGVGLAPQSQKSDLPANAASKSEVAQTATADYPTSGADYTATVVYGQDVSKILIPKDPLRDKSVWVPDLTPVATNYMDTGPDQSIPEQYRLYVDFRWNKRDGSGSETARYLLWVKKAVVAWTDPNDPTPIQVPFGTSPASVVKPQVTAGIDWNKAGWQFSDEGGKLIYDGLAAFENAQSPVGSSYTVRLTAGLSDPRLYQFANGVREVHATYRITVIEPKVPEVPIDPLPGGVIDKTADQSIKASVEYNRGTVDIVAPADPEFPADEWKATVLTEQTNFIPAGLDGASVPGQAGLYATFSWTAKDGSSTRTVRYGLTVSRGVIGWNDFTDTNERLINRGEAPLSVIALPTQTGGIAWSKAVWKFTPDDETLTIYDSYGDFVGAPAAAGSYTVTVAAPVERPDLFVLSGGREAATATYHLTVGALINKTANETLKATVEYNRYAQNIAVPADPAFPLDDWTSEVLVDQTNFQPAGREGASVPGQAGLYATVRWTAKDGSSSETVRYGLSVSKGVIGWPDLNDEQIHAVKRGESPLLSISLPSQTGGIAWSKASFSFVPETPNLPSYDSAAAFASNPPPAGANYTLTVKAPLERPDLFVLSGGREVATATYKLAVTIAYTDKTANGSLRAKVDFGAPASSIAIPEDPQFPAAQWQRSDYLVETDYVASGPQQSKGGQTGLSVTVTWNNRDGRRTHIVKYGLDVVSNLVDWTDINDTTIHELAYGGDPRSVIDLPKRTSPINWANATWSFIPQQPSGAPFLLSPDDFVTFKPAVSYNNNPTVYRVTVTAKLADPQKYAFASGKDVATISYTIRIVPTVTKLTKVGHFYYAIGDQPLTEYARLNAPTAPAGLKDWRFFTATYKGGTPTTYDNRGPLGPREPWTKKPGDSLTQAEANKAPPGTTIVVSLVAEEKGRETSNWAELSYELTVVNEEAEVAYGTLPVWDFGWTDDAIYVVKAAEGNNASSWYKVGNASLSEYESVPANTVYVARVHRNDNTDYAIAVTVTPAVFAGGTVYLSLPQADGFLPVDGGLTVGDLGGSERAANAAGALLNVARAGTYEIWYEDANKERKLYENRSFAPWEIRDAYRRARSALGDAILSVRVNDLDASVTAVNANYRIGDYDVSFIWSR